MRSFLEWLKRILGQIAGWPGGGSGGGGMTEEQATEEVERLYYEIHERDPDEDAQGYVDALVAGTLTVEEVEAEIRGSYEHRQRSEAVVRQLYIDLLDRDPGPPPTEWSDPGALPYVEDYQWGRKTEEQIRAEIMDSDEYKNKPQIKPARPFQVVEAHLLEPDTERRYMPLSISLFYGLSLGILYRRFTRTIDGLAGKIQEARLSMSTFTWGNDQGEPEVNPFLPGNVHEGYSNRINPAFVAEMEQRLEYMIEKDIRPQVTIFWGGVQPMFRSGDWVKMKAMKDFIRPLMELSKRRPEVKWEIINEADHGHHWAYMGVSDRKRLIAELAAFCLTLNPNAHLGVSDGGHPPREWINQRQWAEVVESKEHGGHVMLKNGEVMMDDNGKPLRPTNKGFYFDYHGIRGLADWKVHYPRDKVVAEGIPRWSRGMWHLNGEGHEFSKKHDGKQYGQNDENIFLQTEAEHNEFPYGGATTDWKMVVSSWYVAATARSCSTAHTHKGFFCREGAGEDPAIRLGGPAFQEALKDFEFVGAASINSGWENSPVESFNGPYKAFCLVGGANRRTILITVLQPRQGKLRLSLGRPYQAEVREITGEIRKSTQLAAGVQDFHLPAMSTAHTAIVRLTAI